MINMQEKEYNQVFKKKRWRLEEKHDYKKLKDLDCQPDQPQRSDELIPKWVKVTKSRFIKWEVCSLKV